MKKNMVSGLLAVGLLAASMAANAIPITWHLDGVTFDDGGTATGSFEYDAATNLFSAISITTSANGPFGTTYGIPTGIGNSRFFDTITSFPAAGKPRLLFDLLAPMTDAGGTIGISFFAGGIFDGEGFCTSNSCGNVNPARLITAGGITTAVAEPATLMLFGLSLIGLGLVRRRRS